MQAAGSAFASSTAVLRLAIINASPLQSELSAINSAGRLGVARFRGFKATTIPVIRFDHL